MGRTSEDEAWQGTKERVDTIVVVIVIAISMRGVKPYQLTNRHS